MLQNLATPNVGKAPPEAAMAVRKAETGMDNFLHLMQAELVDPLKQMSVLAARMEELRASGFLPTTMAGQQMFAELAESAQRSARIAERLISLGEMLATSPILSDERVMVFDRLRAGATAQADKARARGVGIRVETPAQTLAPVYGSERWLGLALGRLIGLLIAVAPNGTHLVLRLRQVGFHQLITGSINENTPAHNTSDLLRDARLSVKADLGIAASLERLDLDLVRAVVDLHGGSLKAEVGEGGGLYQFAITLPTGEPEVLRHRPDCANCPVMKQTEQYAQDIGELLNARHAAEPVHSQGSES